MGSGTWILSSPGDSDVDRPQQDFPRFPGPHRDQSPLPQTLTAPYFSLSPSKRPALRDDFTFSSVGI